MVVRGQGITVVVLLTIIMATVALVGIAALRAIRPLVSPEEDRTAMVGERTRVALEREKLLTLRSIKELEFDRAMGKLSDADWQEMSGRLRARAAGLMKQLDAGAGYREQIERDLAKRLAEPTPPATVSAARGHFCTECGTKNESDAKFYLRGGVFVWSRRSSCSPPRWGPSRTPVRWPAFHARSTIFPTDRCRFA